MTALAVRHVRSSSEVPFASYKVAERRRLPPCEIPARHDELEAELLDGFFRYVEQRPDAVWLNWSMSGGGFGFSTLAHRYELYHGRSPLLIEGDRQFDLHAYLKRTVGPDFAPHPRFPKTLALNGLDGGRILGQEAAAAAWRAGEYARMSDSLVAKVRALAILFERLYRGELMTTKGLVRVATGHRGGKPNDDEHLGDGPGNPFQFWWGGEAIDWGKNRKPWMLVRYMWGKESADVTEVMRELWPSSNCVATVRAAACRANALLPGKFPRSLSVLQYQPARFQIRWVPRPGYGGYFKEFHN